jgi:aconitase A
MNTAYRKPLPGTKLDYFDARAAVEAIHPGAYDKLPYTSRVLAENLVRRCDPSTLTASLQQLIERKRELDFPWFPARVVCHDILGQTALVASIPMRSPRTAPSKTDATKTVSISSTGPRRRSATWTSSRRATGSCTRSIWSGCRR